MATCCQGSNPGEVFDTSECVDVFTADELVPQTNLGLLFAGASSPHVTLDQEKAQKCLSLMSDMGCGSDTAAAFKTLYDTCSSALVPQLAEGGAGCLTSFDCPTGTFCGPIASVDDNFVPQVDPSSSSCLPLATAGNACKDDGYSSDCQHLGLLSASDQLFCGATGDAGATTCQPAVSTGSACSSAETEQCTSGLCVDVNLGGSFTCTTTAPFENYEDYSVCATYDSSP